MPSEKEILEVREHCRNENIKVRQQNAPWPEDLRNIADVIKALGQYSVERYGTEEPWRKKNKDRARFLVNAVLSLTNNRDNESQWRSKIENDIFENLTFETTCKTCGKRLWRSEIETAMSPNGPWGSNLTKRQAHRAPCECPPRLRYESEENPMFDSCVEETLKTDYTKSALKHRKPDRCFGFKATGDFDRLLNEARASVDEPVPPQEKIESSPFKKPPLFPFLIMEAKSGFAPQDHRDIQYQSAFPIRELLLLQKKLHDRARREGDHPQRCFVWSIGWRGEYWKVYGCYITTETVGQREVETYNIHEVWSGELAKVSSDEALQLILIIDHIMDWARDTFRPWIMRQLSAVIQRIPIHSIDIFEDGDRYSTYGPSPSPQMQMSSPQYRRLGPSLASIHVRVHQLVASNEILQRAAKNLNGMCATTSESGLRHLPESRHDRSMCTRCWRTDQDLFASNIVEEDERERRIEKRNLQEEIDWLNG